MVMIIMMNTTCEQDKDSQLLTIAVGIIITTI